MQSSSVCICPTRVDPTCLSFHGVSMKTTHKLLLPLALTLA
ncbi:polyisoprenoid-binding protein, partial [Xanthomonas oryzae pv. oryzae]